MKERRLAAVFRRKLLIVSAVILLVSLVFVLASISFVVNRSTYATLNSQLIELGTEINYLSDQNFNSVGIFFVDEETEATEEALSDWMDFIKATGWKVVDKSGTVVYSKDGKSDGTSISDDSDTMVVIERLSDEPKAQCVVFPITSEEFRSGKWTKRVACSLGDGTSLLAEYDSKEYYRQMNMTVDRICSFNTVGAGGFDLILQQGGVIISPTAELRAERGITSPEVQVGDFAERSEEDKLFEVELNKVVYKAVYTQCDGYLAVSLIPKNEVMMGMNIVMLIVALLVLLLMTVIFVRVNMMTNKLVVKNVERINSSLSEITDGNLDVEINVRDISEFRQLSDGINSTVATLKGYIARESERFDRELELAHSIQSSALPGIFPPFPDRHDIDIYAQMTPAKEVGGDFYDFFFTDSRHLVFLVADVSDKGIPAAMFMMKAKTLIKSLSQSCHNIEEVISIANNTLCEDNSADMFVTVWCGVLDTETGRLSYVNAGHCKPLLCRADGEFEYLTERADFVVACEEDVPYNAKSLTLKKGDALFLYSDGVTEAFNKEDVIFGEERLCQTLNAQPVEAAEGLCAIVQKALTEYSEGVAQTDDITMLAVVYRGSKTFAEMTTEAELEKLEEVYNFIEEQLVASDFDAAIVSRIDVIADEICANIVRHAYPDGSGELTVCYTYDPATDEAALTFKDRGIPFNPLNAPEPDLANAEQRAEGGLGIFLVKQFSDKVLYEYSDGQNILTIIKKNNKA